MLWFHEPARNKLLTCPITSTKLGTMTGSGTMVSDISLHRRLASISFCLLFKHRMPGVCWATYAACSVLCVQYDCCCVAIWPKLTIYGEHGRICLCLEAYEFWQTLSRSGILRVAANYTADYLGITCCCRSLEFVLKECLKVDFVLMFT